MPRFPKPWFRKSRGVWYVEIDGRQHNLGPDRKAAFDRYHQLMRQPQREAPISVDSVAAVFDVFLDWTLKHRSRATYGWYQERLQRFLDGHADTPNVGQLRPYHVQQWLDANPGWSDGYKRGCISAIQRASRWAVKMGYLDNSPVSSLEKPPAGHREMLISTELYHQLLGLVSDEAFRDLVQVSWECGCRPQESLRVEARHVAVGRGASSAVSQLPPDHHFAPSFAPGLT